MHTYLHSLQCAKCYYTIVVGVFYLSIQNLPRDERYKPENILLVEIILGLFLQTRYQ